MSVLRAAMGSEHRSGVLIPLRMSSRTPLCGTAFPLSGCVHRQIRRQGGWVVRHVTPGRPPGGAPAPVIDSFEVAEGMTDTSHDGAHFVNHVTATIAGRALPFPVRCPCSGVPWWRFAATQCPMSPMSPSAQCPWEARAPNKPKKITHVFGENGGCLQCGIFDEGRKSQAFDRRAVQGLYHWSLSGRSHKQTKDQP